MKNIKKNFIKAIFCLLTASTLAFGQENLLNVSGIVVNKSEEPLVGVTVKPDGNIQKATMTDANGEFTIQVQKNTVLVFSTIGYKTVKQTVTTEKMKVVMEEETSSLNEVVVTGKQVIDKRYSTGASTNISGATSIYSPPQPQYYDYNTEEYDSPSENRFKEAKSEPLSTFSLEADVASYGNVRRMINNGQMPNKESVRVEEFINYFSYDYAQPDDNNPVKISTEVSTCPWKKQNLLLKIGVKAKEIPSQNLPSSNFVFLIDVSGSMDMPNKLPLVKSSLKLLVNNLREKDKVAIVVYASSTGVVLESTNGSDKQKILGAIENLRAGGSTAGGAGIQLAYKIAEQNFIKNGNNRIILCTDGDFNVGVSSNSDLEKLIEDKRQSGVYLTVLGYGMGNYKDSKLQILSQKGNGNNAYIDNIQEANKVLVKEFGSTMYAVAKDVKIQVEFNPALVNAYRLVGYETRLLNKEDFNDDTKDAGELGAGHTVTAFYEIIPVGVDNPYGGVDPLKYQKKAEPTKPTNTNELLTIKLRYKPIDSDKSLKMEMPVLLSEKNKSTSDDFNFAAAVVMFAQLLKNSDFKGDATYQQVVDLANNGIGTDKNGYRREFVRLVESVAQMVK